MLHSQVMQWFLGHTECSDRSSMSCGREGSDRGKHCSIKSSKCGIHALSLVHKDPRLGFHRERAGGLCYWKRSRQNVAGNLDLAAPRWTQHINVLGKLSGGLWRWLRWRAVFFDDGCGEGVVNIFLDTHFFHLIQTFWSLPKIEGPSLERHDNRLLNHHTASLHVTGRCRWSLSMA